MNLLKAMMHSFVKVSVRHGVIENVLVLVSNYSRLYVNLMILSYVYIGLLLATKKKFLAYLNKLSP